MESPMDWNPPQKPAIYAEYRLVEAILEGQFPIGSCLPAERELSIRLGVTRPTLRETLQRLSRDGWLDIQQGKPTRVKNYFQEGNLAVLGAIVAHREHLPPNFIENLLFVRQLLSPHYIQLAVENSNMEVILLLSQLIHLDDTPQSYAAADWKLHHQLTIYSENPVFTLILNGFSGFYQAMSEIYFTLPACRRASQAFYEKLLVAARQQDGEMAFEISQSVMQASIDLWQAVILSQEK